MVTKIFMLLYAATVSLADTASSLPISAQGPSQPIGHSLKTPEAQKRINQLIAASPLKSKSTLGEKHIDRNLPALVGGQYGFSAPQPIQGIPMAFVSLGDNAPTYGIVVEKLHHRLSLLQLKQDGSYELVKTYRAITGKDPSDKKYTGDLRTPEGIYFVQNFMNDDELAPKYGRMAFTLDYPNIYDQRLHKTGHGIWIHGTDDPKRLEKPFDTQGCVALSNEDISDLKQYMSSFETPVVITKEMTSTTLDEISKQRKTALDMIEAWRLSWEGSNFDLYDGFYSKNFQTLGKNKSQWQKMKSLLSSMRKNSIKVTISNPKILAFEDQLLVVFNQKYESSQKNDFGKKFLYLQWEGDRYRIIAEKWYRKGTTLAQNM